MKKIVTLFGCLLFAIFGFTTTAYAAVGPKLITLSASVLSITSTNFYLIFIALVVAFFLLGLIIGYILNPRRKLRKNKEKALKETAKMKLEEPKELGQDMVRNEAEPIREPNVNPRYGYYNNYRNYYNPPR